MSKEELEEVLEAGARNGELSSDEMFAIWAVMAYVDVEFGDNNEAISFSEIQAGVTEIKAGIEEMGGVGMLFDLIDGMAGNGDGIITENELDMIVPDCYAEYGP